MIKNIIIKRKSKPSIMIIAINRGQEKRLWDYITQELVCLVCIYLYVSMPMFSLSSSLLFEKQIIFLLKLKELKNARIYIFLLYLSLYISNATVAAVHLFLYLLTSATKIFIYNNTINWYLEKKEKNATANVAVFWWIRFN